jgi:hypothetical protein
LDRKTFGFSSDPQRSQSGKTVPINLSPVQVWWNLM